MSFLFTDPNAKATEPPSSSETIIGQEETETDVATWKKLLHSAGGGSNGGSAPLLTETSHIPAGRLWQLPADSTLRLKCVAQGEPEPHLIWLKVIIHHFFHHNQTGLIRNQRNLINSEY